MTAALSCDRCGRSPVSAVDWLHCDACWEAVRADGPPVRLHDWSPLSDCCLACGEHHSAAGPTCEPSTAEPEGMA
jgi:hypothetical protein